MFDRFSTNAKLAMMLAKKAACDGARDCIDTEHALLGLTLVSQCTALRALEGLGIDASMIRDQASRLVKAGSCPQTSTNLPFAATAFDVLKAAMEHASKEGHNYIGTEHLLMGLLRIKKGIAWKVLHGALGLNGKTVWQEVLRVHLLSRQ
jgi:ATP-dependent Clp protease ATP-binding subunit ClpC